ncbi:MAG: 1,4-alpha-glucan branching protein [Chloroflexi bacterium]|nr:MAG: 1,4-alpha-glucan branching protein [Chloroflexota bacterium]
MIKKRFFKTKDECEVTFEYKPEQAKTIAVVCEANGWRPVAMTQRKDGTFKVKMRLPKGQTFQFRYLIDENRWANDEAADNYVPNEYGEQNSVVSTIA